MDELTIAIQRFDLQAFVDARGGVKEGRHEFLLHCPRCQKQKVAVNVARRRWHCLTCEVLGPYGADGKRHAVQGGGSVFALIQWMEGWSPQKTARWIIETAAQERILPLDGQLPDPAFQKQETFVERRPTGLPEKCIACNIMLPYMTRRGITLQDALTFGLGYVPPESGWLSHRIIFPVWEQGACLYWQARACWEEPEHVPRWQGKNLDGVEDKFRKSLNPSQERGGVHYFGASDVLFNLEQASRYPRVRITEGPTSAIAVGPSAVGTFGKRLHPAQIGRLISAGVQAVDFIWDGPTAKEPHGAWPQMLTAAAELAPHMDVRLVFLPRDDPAARMCSRCQRGMPSWRAHCECGGLPTSMYSRDHLEWLCAHARPFSSAESQFL